MNIVKEWTKLDQIIYKIEEKIKDLQERNTEPDVETMIMAETEHLHQENEQLKRKQYPGMLLKQDEQYLCPDCGEIIELELIMKKKKFCPECGKRIMLPL